MKFKGLNIIIICLLNFLPGIISVNAQESHFSQVNKIPLFINPANCGVIDDEFRISNNYRNQWRSLDIPYNTIHIGLDKKMPVRKQMFGISINTTHDLSSSNIIATNKFYIALGYSRFYQNHQFAAGLEAGKVLKSYDPDGIYFGDQFNSNTGDFSGFTNEHDLIYDLNYYDINAGIVWRAKIKDYKPLAGFSIHHLNKPVVSFVKDTIDEKLGFKYTIHGDVLIPLIKKYDLTPVLYYSLMGSSHELITGGIVGYTPEDLYQNISKIYTLTFFRINPSHNIDALIIGGGIEFLHFDLGISYDFNISSLRKVSNFRGAFEISLVFTGRRTVKKESSEPCYML